MSKTLGYAVRLVVGAGLLAAQAGAIGFPAHPKRDAEVKRHKLALMDIKKNEIDVETEYRNALIRCGHDTACLQLAREDRTRAQGEVRIQRNNEMARHKKTMMDLAAAGPEGESWTLGPDGEYHRDDDAAQRR